MTRAEIALGKQEYTGGDQERVERYPRTADQLIRDVVRLRTGRLCQITRLGEVMHSQAVRWSDWPQVKRAFKVTTTNARPRTWLTPRVSEVRTRGDDVVEFTAGEARYRLEAQS